MATASRLTAELARTRFGSEVTADEVRDVLAGDIEKILAPVAKSLEIDLTKIPHVVLVVGVNGVGKTTTIGKLARHYMNEGRSVMLARATHTAPPGSASSSSGANASGAR